MRTLEKARQVLPPPLSRQDMEMARVAQRCIMEALDLSRAAAITLTTDSGEHPTVDVPPAALKLIGQLLIKEIESGRLPHRMVGTHRRVAFEDLIAYARKMRERQEAALERLAENSRELGLDY